MKRVVEIIPAKKTSYKAAEKVKVAKKRVCGYARVSTDEEEQQNSFEAQKSYYTNYITGHDGWVFAGLYSDEGITGTSTKKRDGFNKMIEDAIGGKIDLILTKSISRFARNTVDSLTNIRKLKECGVGVFFEKENINTLDEKSEVILTIMGSLAQEESRSISENTKWGLKKKANDGQYTLAYSRFLGYDKGTDGNLVINKEQAKIVKLIFDLFMQGLSIHDIQKNLFLKNIKTITGKEKWNKQGIVNILTNEKYCGDALLQKTYSTNFLNKKRLKNKGDVSQVYIKDDHEPIVSREIFDSVQLELKKRTAFQKNSGHLRLKSKDIEFINKLFDGDSDTELKRAIYHSNDIYRKVVYKSQNNSITESDLKTKIVECYNKDLIDKKETIKDLKLVKSKVGDIKDLRKKQDALKKEVNTLMNALTELIKSNANEPKDQRKYKIEYNKLTIEYTQKDKELNKVSAEIEDKEKRAREIDLYIKNYEGQNSVAMYEPRIVITNVDKIKLYKDKLEILWNTGLCSTVAR